MLSFILFIGALAFVGKFALGMYVDFVACSLELCIDDGVLRGGVEDPV